MSTGKRMYDGRSTVFFSLADATDVAETNKRDDSDWDYRVTPHGVAYVVMIYDERNEYVATL